MINLKNNKTLRDSIIYTVGDFANVAVSGFIILPLITKLLTADEYGVYATVNASIVLLTYFAIFGLISTYSRMFFNYKTEAELKKFTGHILILHLLISIILLACMVVFKNMWSPIFTGKTSIVHYYVYVFIIPILGFVKNLYSISLRMREKPISFVIYQLGFVLAYITLLIGSLKLVTNQLDAIFFANVIANLLFWIIAIIKLKFQFDLSTMKETVQKVLPFAFPILFGYLLYYIITKFNILFLQKYESMSNIALFSFAFQISTLFTIFAGAFGKAMQPLVYKTQITDLRRTINTMAYKYKLSITGLTALLLLASPLMINILGSNNFGDSLYIAWLLILSTYLYNFRLVESFLILYFNKPRYSVVITICSATSVLIASLILVPKYGYWGSATSITLGSFMAYIANKIITTKLINEEIYAHSD